MNPSNSTVIGNPETSGKRRILYVAYFYPPVGGLGFAGAQRITKFVRYLPCEAAYILTARPDVYPNFLVLDNAISLPIHSEIVYRAGQMDPIGWLLRLRRRLGGGQAPMASGPVRQRAGVEQSAKSRFQAFKDFLHNCAYFPDVFSPWILRAALLGSRVVRKHKVNLIFATGMPWSGLAVGYLISVITRVPLVSDFRDPWIGNPFIISKGRFLDRVERNLEKRIVRQSTAIIANTSELRAQFVSRYETLEPNRFLAVPNGFDSADPRIASRTADANDFLSHARAGKTELHMIHAGSLYGGRDPAPLLEGMRRVTAASNGRFSFKFCQIGYVSVGYELGERFSGEVSDGKLQILKARPFEECVKKMIEGDVLVNFQPDTSTQIPSKFFDYLLLNRPILTIGKTSGALANLIRQHGFGEIFAPLDIEGITQYLYRMAVEKENRGRLRAGYVNRDLFDIRAIAASLSDALSARGI